MPSALQNGVCVWQGWVGEGERDSIQWENVSQAKAWTVSEYVSAMTAAFTKQFSSLNIWMAHTHIYAPVL